MSLNARNHHIHKNHPPKLIIGEKGVGIETISRRKDHILEPGNMSLLYKVEPSRFEESRNDEHLIKAMEEELYQIEKNETWDLVPRPKDKNVIGTKWDFRSKLNEYGQVTRNK